MTDYLIPSGRGEAEYDEKRSRFLGYVKHVETEEEARQFIEEIKKTNYDARHNCWCYLIRGGAERYSDDGEPQGTAGIPMLEVFRKAGVTDAVCVVTRYFGGVLLGAGGLLRAYTKAAKDALTDAGISRMCRMLRYRLSCSYPTAEKLKQFILSLGAVPDSVEYGAEVTMQVTVSEALDETFSEKIFDYTAGSVSPVRCGECFGAMQAGE